MTHPLFSELVNDHDKQRELCQKLISAKDLQARRDLREQLYSELYPHIMGEEDSIFDVLKRSDDEEVRDDALEGLQEHHIDKILLRELMALDPGDDVFKAKAKVLTEVNNHHLDEEEEDIFEHLKKMPDSRLDQLLDRFRQGKESHR